MPHRLFVLPVTFKNYNYLYFEYYIIQPSLYSPIVFTKVFTLKHNTHKIFTFPDKQLCNSLNCNVL